MPCMCGDICCNSCGPAQGNSKCYNCGEWESEGGCKDPIACDLALLRIGHHDRMIELTESGDITEKEQKQLTAWRIMRKDIRKTFAWSNF